MFTEGVSKGFLQDVEIWKHKTRIDNPLLVEEDGAVYQMRRWYQQFYVDVADVTPDMTDRFEIEIDTTAANEKWHVEVEENLKRQAEEKEKADTELAMSARERNAPDVDRLARSMLMLYGAHDDDDHEHATAAESSKRAADPGRRHRLSAPDRAAALREATQRDRERYLTSGLVSVDCRFCHVSVDVKKLGPGHTSVQWNTEASQRCAYFAEIRQSGGDPARTRSCPKLADSIKHAVAEGCLEEVSSAPSPGDG